MPATWRTEGQRLFFEVRGTMRQIGVELGVPFQSIEQWKSGDITPGTRARERIEKLYKIPQAAWERLPAGAMPPVADDDDESESGTVAGELGDDDDADGDAVSLADDYRQQLKELRKALAKPDLLMRDRLALNDAFGKALERRRKYELQSEMLEDRIVRGHPAWQRFKRLVMTALLAHPAAARDVEAAIKAALESEDY